MSSLDEEFGIRTGPKTLRELKPDAVQEDGRNQNDAKQQQDTSCGFCNGFGRLRVDENRDNGFDNESEQSWPQHIGTGFIQQDAQDPPEDVDPRVLTPSRALHPVRFPSKHGPKRKEWLLVREANEMDDSAFVQQEPDLDDSFANGGPCCAYMLEDILGKAEDANFVKLQARDGVQSAVLTPETFSEVGAVSNSVRFVCSYAPWLYDTNSRLLRSALQSCTPGMVSSQLSELFTNNNDLCDGCGNELRDKWRDGNGIQHSDLYVHTRPIVPRIYHKLLPTHAKTCSCFYMQLCIECYLLANAAEKKLMSLFEQIAKCPPVESRIIRPMSAEIEQREDEKQTDSGAFRGSNCHYKKCTGAMDGCQVCSRKIMAKTLRESSDNKTELKSAGAISTTFYHFMAAGKGGSLPLETDPRALSDHERAVFEWFAIRYKGKAIDQLAENCRGIYRAFLKISGDISKTHLWLDHSCNKCIWCNCAQMGGQAYQHKSIN